MLEIHFFAALEYMDANDPIIYHRLYCQDWVSTECMFEKCKDALKRMGDNFNHKLYTVEMSFLREAWDLHCEYGVKIFVHDSTGAYEISEDNGCTDRQLRRAHDIFKLWRGGAFANRKEN